MSSIERNRRNSSKLKNGKAGNEVKTREFYNDRFRLKEVSSLLDPNSISQISSNKANFPKLKLPHISPPEKASSDRSPPVILIDSEESFPELMKTLESLWTRKSIPEELQKVLKTCIEKLPRQKSINLLQHEIKSLKDNTSQTQLVLKAIKSREESLNSVHELNNYLKTTNWLPLKEVHFQCAELLHGHRLFTLNAVESLSKWRKTLINSLVVNNTPAGFIEFKYESENYLLKMRKDLDFLKTSEFAKVLNFSEENDPLLVSPSIPIGKIERGRKRDPNYFLDDGQVIVPIPSFMMSRVKEAEETIKLEFEYVKFLSENTPEKQAEMFSPKILETIIEEVVDEAVEELQSLVKSDQDALSSQKRQEREAEKSLRSTADNLINSLILTELENIAEESLKSQKDLETDKLAGFFLSSLIESSLSDLLPLSSTTLTEAQESFKAEQELINKQKAEQIDKISKELSASLFEEFLQKSLKDVALESLKEIRKAREEESLMYVVKSPLMEEIGLDFATIEFFEDLEEMKWIPLHLPEELIGDIMNEYYSVSPDENHTIMPDIENLLIESSKYTDPCWYWAIKGTLILGFLVFSTDCFNKTGKKIIVHHISSLYWNKFSDILASATELVWKVTNCDEIRINIFTKLGKDLTPDTKRVFTQQGFKWKTKYQVKESPHEITVLGKSKGQKNTSPAFVAFLLKCSEVITTSEAKSLQIPNKSHINRVGNRQNMLHALLGLFGKLDNSSLRLPDKVDNKLQEALNGHFTAMNDSQSFSFPSITGATSESNLQEFLTVQALDSVLPCPKAAASVLEIKFRWVSCTNYSLPIKNKTVRYMRFKTQELKCMKLAESIESFYVPTENPNIRAFFIKAEDLQSSLSRTLSSNLDLFSFIETIFTSSASEAVTEIWVPCFQFNSNSALNWLAGYEITPQQEGYQTLYVKNCEEKISLKMNTAEVPDGLLIVNNRYGPVFINDFIFGLFYCKGDKILDIPLFTCLVKEEDWVLV